VPSLDLAVYVSTDYEYHLVMRALWPVVLGITFAALFAPPVRAHQVALRDGRVIQFEKYRVADGSLVYTGSDGKEAKIALADIDLTRTRQLSAADVPPLDLPGLANQGAAPSPEQSLGAIARKVRPKDTSVTGQRVFTDDDVAHRSDSSTPQTSQPTTAAEYRSSMGDLERWVDEKAGLKPRQLSESVAGLTTFPGREEWEQRLFDQKEKLVAVVRSAANTIQRMGNAQTESERASARIAVDKLEGDVRFERHLYDQLIAEGVKRAADWEKKPR
jgi:hypothetical protein